MYIFTYIYIYTHMYISFLNNMMTQHDCTQELLSLSDCEWADGTRAEKPCDCCGRARPGTWIDDITWRSSKICFWSFNIADIAIENSHLQWILHLNMVIFHSDVKLPEGKL